jgi:hypothetical protein
MQPGECITIIKKAAETLAPQGWAEIDLVLDQFGFPTEAEEWGSNTERTYLVAMLKSGQTTISLPSMHTCIPVRFRRQSRSLKWSTLPRAHGPPEGFGSSSLTSPARRRT